LQDLYVKGRIILKWFFFFSRALQHNCPGMNLSLRLIVRKMDLEEIGFEGWTRFIWLRIRTKQVSGY
jgi:hypothetical protein